MSQTVREVSAASMESNSPDSSLKDRKPDKDGLAGFVVICRVVGIQTPILGPSLGNTKLLVPTQPSKIDS